MKHSLLIKVLLIFNFQFVIYPSYEECLSQWYQQYSGTTANLYGVKFINQLTGFVVGDTGICLKTTNEGVNWFRLNTDTNGFLRDVDFPTSNTGFIVGKWVRKKTTDGGNTWFTPSYQYMAGDFERVSFADTSVGVTGGWGSARYTSNGGLNWYLCNNLPGSSFTWGVKMVNQLTGFVGVYDFIGTQYGYVYKTTNGGINWFSTFTTYAPTPYEITGVSFIDANTGMAVEFGGYVYVTTNGGNNWQTVILPNGGFNVQVVTKSKAFIAGCIGYGSTNLLYSSNTGVNWVMQYPPVSTCLRSLSFSDSLHGTIVGDGGVILHTTNGGISGILPINSNIPKRFELNQNYPNPFNPSSKIKFNIPSISYPFTKGGQGSLTILKIYDLLGREVVTLVNEKLNPGIYEVEFDGTNFSSGVYFYKLISGDFVSTKKMVLMK